MIEIIYIIFRHGGPGGGCMDLDRGYFDPSVYRIILLDQRGAGKSTPAAELEVGNSFSRWSNQTLNNVLFTDL